MANEKCAAQPKSGAQRERKTERERESEWAGDSLDSQTAEIESCEYIYVDIIKNICWVTGGRRTAQRTIAAESVIHSESESDSESRTKHE